MANKWSNTSQPREKNVSRKKIWERDKGICAMCLRQCANNGNTRDGWDADHVQPVYAGGAQERGAGITHLRTLCRMYCHKAVSAKQASERAAEIREVTKPK